MTDEQIIEKVKKFRDDIIMGNTDLSERMEKAKRMTYRDHWDPATRAWNEKKEKFSLTIPVIKPKIKQVVGMQIQNPKDISVEAGRGGSETGSRIITKLAKHASDTQYSIFQRTQWFEAGLAAGVGYIGVIIDKNEDPKNGNLRIEKLDESECGIDPDCNVYDINSFHQGAKCFSWRPWIDKDLIEATYPDKVDKIKESGAVMPGDTTGIWSWLRSGVRSAFNTLSGDRILRSENLNEHKYQINHLWWRRPKRCLMLYDERQNELDAITLTKDKDIAAARGLVKAHPDTFTGYEVVRNIMCHTVTTSDDGVLLENNEDELNGINMFPIVPWSPSFDCGYRGGMSEDCVSTQEEINVLHSMKLNIMKKLPNTGWYIKDDPLGDFEAWLQEHGAEDNIIINRKRGGGDVEKITETKFPVGIDHMEESAIKNMHITTGVRSEDTSYDRANLSGKALLAKMQMSMTGNTPILMNFDYSQSVLNNLIVEIIRRNKIYSLDEILEIVDTDEMIDGQLMEQARQQVKELLSKQGIELPEEPPVLDPQAAEIDESYIQNYAADVEMVRRTREIVDKLAAPIAMDLLYDEISNLKKGRYNSTVTMSPYSPTMMEAEKAELLEISETLLKTGQPPIPGSRILKASQLPDKEEIIKEYEAQAQAQAQAMPVPAKAG